MPRETAMEQSEKDAIAAAKLAHLLKITPKQGAVIVLWFKLAIAFRR